MLSNIIVIIDQYQYDHSSINMNDLNFSGHLSIPIEQSIITDLHDYWVILNSTDRANMIIWSQMIH